jgi:tetraacyldisaccharide 4'-kinase
MRLELYRKNWLKSHDLGALVVSVGNLTVGGTGKTPLVAFVAKILAENNHKVCILTRGYKRANPSERVLVSDGTKVLVNAKSAGDEPFLLALELIGEAAVIADKNRVAAGMWAKENLGATAFVLDDGFQHLQLKRDLDIVTVDATNPFGNGRLLPAGILREPLASLKRADAIVLTRTKLSNEISNLKLKIAKFNSLAPILSSNTKTIELKSLAEFLRFPAKAGNTQSGKKGQKAKDKGQFFAFCALGNPRGFFEHLRGENFQLRATKIFPDHHAYSQKNVAAIENAARAAGAEVLLTTAKDAVKLGSLSFSLPCLVVEIEVEFDDETILRAMLHGVKSRAEI